MGSKLGLKFKRTKTLAVRANSICCLYQRQQFARKLIEQMMAGKRIINIDEASLGQAAFLRRGWAATGDSLRYLPQPLGHRLSVFAGVDTFGKTYFSVSQAYTDGRTFGGFI